MAMKHLVKLTPDERDLLERIVNKDKSTAWRIQHAYALLKLDSAEVSFTFTYEKP
jgi:hypothetical protein